VKRLVVFAPNWLGDAVMALPAIADVRRGLPAASVDVAARPSVAPLFAMVPDVADVVSIDRGRVVAALRDRQYDAALLLTNSFQSALSARRAGIGERWGYRTDFRAPLLTRRVVAPVSVHQAEYYQHLVRALGFATGALVPRVDLPAAARAAASDLLRREGWDGRAPLVALAPGAAYGGAKRWPATSFAGVARRLTEAGATAVLIGSAADAEIGGEVAAALGSSYTAIDLIGRTDLPTLGGVLAGCRALVTNDSGAMHLAAALGVPVVAMFGASNEHKSRPLGAGRRVVLSHEVWCRPCMLRECPLTHACMRGISVDAVVEAARSAW
jgi:heptosyltransferase II